jgi:hypothetical protein
MILRLERKSPLFPLILAFPDPVWRKRMFMDVMERGKRWPNSLNVHSDFPRGDVKLRGDLRYERKWNCSHRHEDEWCEWWAVRRAVSVYAGMRDEHLAGLTKRSFECCVSFFLRRCSWIESSWRVYRLRTDSVYVQFMGITSEVLLSLRVAQIFSPHATPQKKYIYIYTHTHTHTHTHSRTVWKLSLCTPWRRIVAAEM